MTDTAPAGTEEPSRRASLAVTAALVAVALAARVWTALHPWGLGQDACSYLFTARDLLDGAVGSGHWPLRMTHPGYSLAIAAFGAVGVDLEVAARAISIAASCALVALVHRTWTAWRGSREGTVLALLFALHPGLALYGGEIWVEPVQILLLFAAFRGCVDLWESPSPARRAALVAVAFGLAACFKNNAVVFVGGAALALVLPRPAGVPLRRVVVTALVFAAVLLPVALAPQLAELVVRGRLTPVGALPIGRTLMDEQALRALDADPDMAPRDPVLVLSQWRRLLGYVGPRTVFPWWIYVPLVVLGVRGLWRARGRAARYAYVAGAAIAIEWVFMTFYGIQDRYMLFGHLVLLPLAAAGLTELGRLVPARISRAAPLAALALLCAVWLRSFVRTNAENGAKVNSYRDAGLLLRALDAPPRRLLSTTSETAWLGGASVQLFTGSTWDEVERAMASGGCDALVVGGKEAALCPDLAPARDLATGAAWRGMRVVVHVAGPDPLSVLTR